MDKRLADASRGWQKDLRGELGTPVINNVRRDAMEAEHVMDE